MALVDTELMTAFMTPTGIIRAAESHDHEKRDVEPSKKKGVFSIYYAELKNVSLVAKAIIICNGLLKLQHLLSDVQTQTF